MAQKLINDIESAKQHKMSLLELQDRVALHLGALDATFPQDIKKLLGDVYFIVEDLRQDQYVATLNTPQEGTFDETLPIGDSFDDIIFRLKNYVGNISTDIYD